MIELTGNLWDYYCTAGHEICITTNGFVKNNGDAVMGRGCALEATRIIPGIAGMLGTYIKKNGNVPGFIRTEPDEFGVIIFPVKHKWWEKASLDLIHISARFLNDYAVNNPDIKYHLPRPGCGNGGLFWEEVKPLISFLPDNVIAMTR